MLISNCESQINLRPEKLSVKSNCESQAQNKVMFLLQRLKEK